MLRFFGSGRQVFYLLFLHNEILEDQRIHVGREKAQRFGGRQTMGSPRT